MNRFTDVELCSPTQLTSVYGYRSQSLISLEEALAPFFPHIEQLARHAKTAKQHCHYPSEHGLTQDESAAIYLYSMDWGEQSLHRVLNRTLREENGRSVNVWIPYLKLFMTALAKLPATKGIFWRGTSEGVGHQFARNQVFNWWGMTSCSTTVHAIEELFRKDKRSTIFLIEAANGRQISAYIANQSDEVLLMMGTQFRVNGDPIISFNGQDMVYLVEVNEKDRQGAPTLLVTDVPKIEYHHWNEQGTTIAGGYGEGRQLSQLSHPCGVFVDQDLSVFVADHHNHRVVCWRWGAKSGSVVAGGNGEGNRKNQLSQPTDVLVDQRDQSIIVADRGNRRVMRWSLPNAAHSQIVIDDIACSSIAMDKQGFLYVADSERHEVTRWKVDDMQSTVVAGGHGPGDRLDQLNTPSFLFVDDNQSVYVSDSANQRVMKWSRGASEGMVVAGGKGLGDGLSQLCEPGAVVVDRDGQVLVADGGNHRVMCWLEGDSEGELRVAEDSQERKTDRLSHPSGLAVDDKGNLYVADRANNRIQKFNFARENK